MQLVPTYEAGAGIKKFQSFRKKLFQNEKMVTCDPKGLLRPSPTWFCIKPICWEIFLIKVRSYRIHVKLSSCCCRLATRTNASMNKCCSIENRTVNRNNVLHNVLFKVNTNFFLWVLLKILLLDHFNNTHSYVEYMF